MPRGTTTQTKVQAITKTKMAIALAFLGAASIAAAGMGGRMMQRQQVAASQPDLIVRSIAFNEAKPYDQSSGTVLEGYDKVTVYYQNIGKAAVPAPFDVHVFFGTDIVDTDEVYPMVLEDLDENNPFVAQAPGAGKNVYKLTAAHTSEISDAAPHLKKFNLAPGEWGQMQLFVPTIYQEDVGDKLSIRAFVDRPKQIAESNEKNNLRKISVAKDKLSQKPVIDETPFCASNAATSCAERYEQLGVNTGSLLSTYVCAGVYKGMPVLETSDGLTVMTLDEEANVTLAYSLNKCSLTNNQYVKDMNEVVACIDELKKDIENEPFYLDEATCFVPEQFCSLSAEIDPYACERRFEAETDLPEAAWKSIVNNYECAGVHRGVPIIKVGDEFASLGWDQGANVILADTFQSCEYISTNYAPTLNMAMACIDNKKDSVEQLNGLYIDESFCTQQDVFPPATVNLSVSEDTAPGQFVAVQEKQAPLTDLAVVAWDIEADHTPLRIDEIIVDNITSVEETPAVKKYSVYIDGFLFSHVFPQSFPFAIDMGGLPIPKEEGKRIEVRTEVDFVPTSANEGKQFVQLGLVEIDAVSQLSGEKLSVEQTINLIEGESSLEGNKITLIFLPSEDETVSTETSTDTQ